MSLFRQFEKVAKSHAQKTAMLSRHSKISYGDILNLMDAFEQKLQPHMAGGKTSIALASNKLEFYVIMMLVASRNSYKLFFCDPETLRNCGVEYDLAVSELDLKAEVAGSYLKIDKSWLQRRRGGQNAKAQHIGGNAFFIPKTSGSTGQPMLFPIEEAAYVAGLEYAPEFLNMEPFDARVYCSISGGMRWSQNVALRALLRGGSIFSAPINEDYMPNLIDVHRVDVLAITPAFATKLLAVDNIAQYLKGIRKIVMGGAFVSPKLVKQMAGITTASITVSFGSTENNGMVAYTYDPDVIHADNYLGEIIDPDFDIVFFDPETRERISGNEGLIGIAHPRIVTSTAYLNTIGDTRKNAFKDGYFMPGDIMRREGNSLFHLGRSSNIVNIGGNKFSVDMLEQVLSAIPEITGIAIFSQRDKDDVEQLFAAYSATRELSLQELNDVLVANREFKFAEVHHARRFNALPLNASTKIDRMKVKEQYFR